MADAVVEELQAAFSPWCAATGVFRGDAGGDPFVEFPPFLGHRKSRLRSWQRPINRFRSSRNEVREKSTVQRDPIRASDLVLHVFPASRPSTNSNAPSPQRPHHPEDAAARE